MSAWTQTKSSLSEVEATIRRMDPFDLCSILTLFLLMFHAGDFWYMTIPLRILCFSALVFPFLRTNPALWLSLSIVLVIGNVHNRITIDNHKYLINYWCLVMFLVLCVPRERRTEVFSVNARLLIGLCFGFAAIHKLLSLDYLDGRFFQHELLFEERFETFSCLTVGLDRGALQELRNLRAEMVYGYERGLDITEIDLIESARLMAMSRFLTGWTFLIEVLIATLFLWWKPNRMIHWGRHALLIIFVVTTYSVALVAGFAWPVIIMGIAQLPVGFERLRHVYLFLCIVFLQLCEAPIAKIFERLFGS